MPEGYCVKCKAKKEIANAVEEVMKNGRKAIKGKCPTCGTVMFKILGGKATPPPPAAGEPGKPPSTTGPYVATRTGLRHHHSLFPAQIPDRRNFKPTALPNRIGPRS